MRAVKKGLSVFLVCVMMLCSAPLAGFVGLNLPEIDFGKNFNVKAGAAEIIDSGSCGENVIYTLDNDGVLTISGTGAMTDYSNYNSIPWYLSRSSIMKINIEDGITSIGRFAFYDCQSVTLVTIPDSVSIVGVAAFANCKALNLITIPDSVINIGRAAFSNTAYYNNANNWVNDVLYITNHLIEAKNTIYNHYSVINGTKTIADNAFEYCSDLTTIFIPNSVINIGVMAFLDCKALTTVTFDQISQLAIIGGWAFYNCTALTDINIPNSVLKIGESAFRNCELLTSITIPAKVTTIEDNLFWDCSSLTSISMPDCITAIGNYAFNNCISLTEISIPSAVTSIGESAFDGCSSLCSVVIPNNVTYLGDYSFATCTSLSSIQLSDNVLNIGEYTFWWCEKLTEITIPSSVTKIGKEAFNKCLSLTSITILNPTCLIYDSSDTIPATTVIYGYNKSFADSYSVEYSRSFISIDKEEAEIIDIGYCGSNVAWYLTVDGVLTISGTGAMENYSYYDYVPWHSNRDSIKTVVIENGVTNIGDFAFYACNLLTSVNIPNSVTSIEDNAFRGCTSLPSINIPNSVTSIGEWCFAHCTSIASVNIPENVTNIGSSAFYNCTSLTSVTISTNSLTSIADSMFENCTSLISVTFPMNSVTSIESGAFSTCTSLTTINIPDSVTYIGSSAFYRCSSLAEIFIINPDCRIEDSSSTIYSSTVIRGYDNSTAQAYAKQYNRTFVSLNGNADDIIFSGYIGDNVDFIITRAGDMSITGNGEMYNYDNWNHPWHKYAGMIKSIFIADGITSIGNYAFYDCVQLPSITIPASVTSIGRSAFSGCKSLTFVNIPNSITSIGAWAFYNCSSLPSITFPTSITSIGDSAFSNCTALASVYISDLAAWCNIDFYDYYSNPLFYAKNLYLNETLVTELTIPESVTAIKNCAFSRCTSLISVYIPDSVMSIGDFAFYNCTSLSSISIGNSITTIGRCAFEYCNSLSSVFISSLAAWCNIDFSESYSNPLYYSNNLYLNRMLITELDVPTSVKEIKNYAFYNCNSLISVNIPDTVISIGDYAFFDCIALTKITILNPSCLISDYSETIPEKTKIIGYDNSTAKVYARKHIRTFEIFNCKHEKTEVIPAVPATCTTTGLSAGTKCLLCKTVVQQPEVTSIIEHSYLATVTTPATHLQTGICTYTCQCGDTYTEVIEKLTEHTYQTSIIEPTCEFGGYTVYYCNCGNSYIADHVTALGHAYVGTVTTNPTCTTAGVKTFVCSNDESHTYTETVAALGHDWGEWTTVTAATCDADGIEKRVCKTDASHVEENTLPAFGHTAGTAEMEDKVEATCTVNGTYNMVVYCATCSEKLSTTAYTITAPGHTPGADATCTTDQTCTVCGEVLTEQFGHDYKAVVTAPTCEADGFTTYTCATCGDTYNSDTVAALDHAYIGTVTTAPTCTTAGVKTYVCSNDESHTYTETVAALGHDWGEWTTVTAATCDADGIEKRVCKTDASHVEENTLPAFGHTAGTAEMEDKVEATCTVNGTYNMVVYCATCSEKLSTTAYTITAPGHAPGTDATCTTDQTCTVCGEVLTEKLGHDYKAVVTAPTCDVDGFTTYTCVICGDSYTADEVTALGHDYVGTITTAPTCTTAGVKTYVCSNDTSHTYTETVAALGHTPGADATCTTDQTCTVCGEVLTTQFGHDYKAVVTAPTCEADGFTTYTCATCGDSYVADTVAALGHSWDEGVITVEPTVEAEGVMTYTCSVCGATKTEVIEKLQPAFTESEDAILTDDGNICANIGKTAESLLAQASDGATLVDKNGNALSADSKVGTGAVLTLADGTEYVIIVPGDTDGDAAITSADARFALRYSVGLETLPADSVFVLAADVDTAGVTASDARSILRAAVGLDDPDAWFEKIA